MAIWGKKVYYNCLKQPNHISHMQRRIFMKIQEITVSTGDNEAGMESRQESIMILKFDWKKV